MGGGGTYLEGGVRVFTLYVLYQLVSTLRDPDTQRWVSSIRVEVVFDLIVGVEYTYIMGGGGTDILGHSYFVALIFSDNHRIGEVAFIL